MPANPPNTSSITTATLEFLKAQLPPPPSPQVFVVRETVAEALRAQCKPAAVSGLSSVLGIICFAKPGQVADAWAFADPKQARQYMDGEITEGELAAMSISRRATPAPAETVS